MTRFIAQATLTMLIFGMTSATHAQTLSPPEMWPVNRSAGCSIFAQPTLFRWSGQPDGEGGPPGMDEPLASDRPDFTEASTTVGRRVLQIEMGYTYSYDTNQGIRSHAHSFPETLFRWGVLADWLELRLAYNRGSTHITLGGGPFEALSGDEDLYLGAKLGLTSQHGLLPEMALMPQATVPSGSDELTADETLPGVNWLYGWDITDRINMGGSTQANKSVDVDGTNYVEVAQSWTIGFGWTDRLSSYTEWFCLLPSGATTVKPEYYFDGGFTYGVTNNLQLDIRAGVGLNEQSADYFVGSGAVMRF